MILLSHQVDFSLNWRLLNLTAGLTVSGRRTAPTSNRRPFVTCNCRQSGSFVVKSHNVVVVVVAVVAERNFFEFFEFSIRLSLGGIKNEG